MLHRPRMHTPAVGNPEVALEVFQQPGPRGAHAEVSACMFALMLRIEPFIDLRQPIKPIEVLRLEDGEERN